MTVEAAPTGSGAPSWGSQTGVLQRRQPAFWLFVITLVCTGLAMLSEQLAFLAGAPGAWFVTILLLIPYAIPVIAMIYFLDLYEREPLSILVAAFLWGGVVATTLSMYTNTPLGELVFKITGDADFTNTWSAALTAPFVEEGFKLLGIIVLVSIARDELDDVLDGFIWGAMVGIGFLLVEDVFYFMRAFGSEGTYGSLAFMFLIRILGAGPYSHFLYTGLSGMGVAYYYTQLDQAKSRRLLVAAGYVALGVACHFLWNSPILSSMFGDDLIGFWLMVTVKGLPMLIGLIVLIRLARKRERRWFATFTQAFEDDGSVTHADLAELSGLRARRRARKAAARAKGPMGATLKGQIQRGQMNLAQLMSKHGSEDHPEVAAQKAQVLELKAHLDALAGPAVGATAGAWGAAAPATAATAQAWGVAAAPAAAPAATAAPAWGVTAAPAAAAAPAWGQPAQVPVQQPTAQPAQPVTQPAPAPAQWGQPAPAPAPPAPAPPALAWIPTHGVPEGGMPAWAAPDPSRAPIVTLAARLDLVVAERAGDWARVVAVNGWTGWVDARRLTARS